jgi:hypothetical protein
MLLAGAIRPRRTSYPSREQDELVILPESPQLAPWICEGAPSSPSRGPREPHPHEHGECSTNHGEWPFWAVGGLLRPEQGCQPPLSPAGGYGGPWGINVARAKGGFRMHALNWRKPWPNSARFANASARRCPQATIDASSRLTLGT